MRVLASIALCLAAFRACAQEPSGAVHAYGGFDDKYFRSTASLEDIRKAPQWSPAAEQAPRLAPGQAQAIARKQLDRIAPSNSKWYLEDIRLVAAVEGTHWYYEVSFWRKYPPEVAVYGGDRFDFIVLLDGTSPEPKPEPRPGPDHSNGT